LALTLKSEQGEYNMKKIAALIAMVGILTSGVAFAAGDLASGGTPLTDPNGPTITAGATSAAAQAQGAPMIGRLSKGVHLGVNYDNSGYALTTKHLTGTKMYGTAFDSTSIFSQDATAIVSPTAKNSTAFPNSSWTAM
jgi:hypothetical protein